MTYLKDPTEATGRAEHRPAAVWLVSAVSMLVGIVLVVTIPIFAVALVVGLLGATALSHIGKTRQLLLAIGLGLAVPTVVYFGLAIARH
jgi:4-hydroxybenzoate polyprenyltransferase